MKTRTHILAAALASSALVAGGTAFAQANMNVGTAGISGGARATGPGGGMTNTSATVGAQTGAGPSTMGNSANGAMANPGAGVSTNSSVKAHGRMKAQTRMQPVMQNAANARGAGMNDMTMQKAAALRGRQVVGANGRVIGTVAGVQRGANGIANLKLSTAQNVGLHGKAVMLPAAMFSTQTSGNGQLKAPTVTRKDLHQMSSAQANNPNPM